MRRDIDELLGRTEYGLVFDTGVDSCGGDPDEDGGVIIGGMRLMTRTLSVGSRRYRARLKAEQVNRHSVRFQLNTDAIAFKTSFARYASNQ